MKMKRILFDKTHSAQRLDSQEISHAKNNRRSKEAFNPPRVLSNWGSRHYNAHNQQPIRGSKGQSLLPKNRTLIHFLLGQE